MKRNTFSQLIQIIKDNAIRGRPKKTEPLEAECKTRLTRAEKALFSKCAQEQNKSVSVLLRELIYNHIESSGRYYKTKNGDENELY